MEQLLEHWESVTCFTSEEIRKKWWSIICEKYTAEGRIYHNHSYLIALFEFFHQYKEKLSNPEAICLSIFFHKLEYNPRSGDGDEKSIDQFKQFIKEAGEGHTDSSLAAAVMSLLEAASSNLTDVHMTKGINGSADIHFFLDFIVAVLGSTEKEYAQYVIKVQAEYSHLSSQAYNQLRTKTLKNLLLIPNVYATRVFREEREYVARENIQKEISQLERLQIFS